MKILELNKMVMGCTLCPDLCKTRNGVVSGAGSGSKLMVLGEAPGSDEDETGEPFIGRCGDLLTKMLEGTGIKRDSIYITNVVKCRPTKDNKGRSNRPPSTEEVSNCKRWLWGEIKALKPKAILTLDLEYMEDTCVVPCYHPSYLMQTGKNKMDISIRCIKIAKRRAGI